ncbi:methenyltetrahydromethanopterin cyclohydrolase [Methanopyrus sp.]
MVSMNENALPLVKWMIERAELLNVEVQELENGTTVIDCGVKTAGGFDAGILFSEVCMGGLATVELTEFEHDGLCLPAVQVTTDHPAVSTLAAQKAGWQVQVGDYFAMGSGPARALALKPKETYEEIDYSDDADVAILCLESSELPDEDVAEHVADECGVDPENLYLLVAPTASIVGSVQVSARVVETGLYKLLEVLEYDVTRVKYATGTAPIAPIAADDGEAMGRTNDCILYGGTVYLYVEGDDELPEIVEELPSKASEDYGNPFMKIFEEADYDFYKIDPGVFAPARVVVNDLSTGKTYTSGEINVDVLKESFDI